MKAALTSDSDGLILDSARCVPEMSRQRSFCLVIVLNATLTGHFHWPKCNAKDCYGGSTEESQPEPQGSCGSVSKPQLPTAWWVPLCAITLGTSPGVPQNPPTRSFSCFEQVCIAGKVLGADDRRKGHIETHLRTGRPRKGCALRSGEIWAFKGRARVSSIQLRITPR